MRQTETRPITLSFSTILTVMLLLTARLARAAALTQTRLAISEGMPAKITWHYDPQNSRAPSVQPFLAFNAQHAQSIISASSDVSVHLAENPCGLFLQTSVKEAVCVVPVESEQCQSYRLPSTSNSSRVTEQLQQIQVQLPTKRDKLQTQECVAFRECEKTTLLSLQGANRAYAVPISLREAENIIILRSANNFIHVPALTQYMSDMNFSQVSRSVAVHINGVPLNKQRELSLSIMPPDYLLIRARSRHECSTVHELRVQFTFNGNQPPELLQLSLIVLPTSKAFHNRLYKLSYEVRGFSNLFFYTTGLNRQVVMACLALCFFANRTLRTAVGGALVTVGDNLLSVSTGAGWNDRKRLWAATVYNRKHFANLSQDQCELVAKIERKLNELEVAQQADSAQVPINRWGLFATPHKGSHTIKLKSIYQYIAKHTTNSDGSLSDAEMSALVLRGAFVVKMNIQLKIDTAELIFEMFEGMEFLIEIEEIGHDTFTKLFAEASGLKKLNLPDAMHDATTLAAWNTMVDEYVRLSKNYTDPKFIKPESVPYALDLFMQYKLEAQREQELSEVTSPRLTFA